MSDHNDDDYVDFSHNVDLYDVGHRRSSWQYGFYGAGGLLVLIALLFAVFGHGAKHKQIVLPPPPIANSSTTSGGSTTSVKSAEPVDQAIKSTVNGAMAAWAKFASTGSLKGLNTYFITDGPQYANFKSPKNPPNGLAYVFTVKSQSISSSPSPTESKVNVSLLITTGASRTTPVDLLLDVRKGSDGKWRIWSVNS